MTYDEAVSAIDRYEELTARAVEIVRDAPYWYYVDNPEWARIEIREGINTAVLHTCNASAGWEGSADFDTDRREFPADLLFLSDTQLAAWKANKRAEYDRLQEEAREQKRLSAEAKERAAYLALKQKYEPSV